MAELQPFIYNQLDRNKKEIRLLHLTNLDIVLELTKLIEADPEVDNDKPRVRSIEQEFPIRCQIRHVSLDEKPVYVALSYTWGDAANKRRLIVEDGGKEYELIITENLDAALRHLAIDGEFWIDAVCINQSDEVEKTWQVQQMWTIYHDAKYVATWLGHAADDSDKVIRQIADVIELRHVQIEGKQPSEAFSILQSWTPPIDFLDLPAFAALLKRPYWRRLWIQQELHASENVWFHVGLRKTHLSLLNIVLGFLTKIRNNFRKEKLGVIRRDSYPAYLGALVSDESTRVVSRAIRASETRKRLGLHPFIGLLKMIYVLGNGLEASDPRDRVFGLLGMSRDAAALGIVPDYSKSKAQIFTQVAIALINQFGLEVLTWNNFDAPSSASSMLSWVPDWSAQLLLPLGEFGRKTNCYYNACGDAKAAFKFLNSSKDPPLLSMKGTKVDKIQAVDLSLGQVRISDLSHYTTDADPNYALQLQWLSDIEELSKQCKQYSGRERTEAAVWRTAIADQEFTPEGKDQRASPSLENGYRLYKTGLLRAVIKETDHRYRADDLREASRYYKQLLFRSSGRRYFVTEKGYLGLGPARALPGDCIVIFLGMTVPMVLRSVEGGSCQVVGQAYVHGMMDGEMMKENTRIEEIQLS